MHLGFSTKQKRGEIQDSFTVAGSVPNLPINFILIIYNIPKSSPGVARYLRAGGKWGKTFVG